jgi:hypothetical protein
MPLERLPLDAALPAINIELGRMEFQRALSDG